MNRSSVFRRLASCVHAGGGGTMAIRAGPGLVAVSIGSPVRLERRAGPRSRWRGARGLDVAPRATDRRLRPAGMVAGASGERARSRAGTRARRGSISIRASATSSCGSEASAGSSATSPSSGRRSRRPSPGKRNASDARTLRRCSRSVGRRKPSSRARCGRLHPLKRSSRLTGFSSRRRIDSGNR